MRIRTTGQNSLYDSKIQMKQSNGVLSMRKRGFRLAIVLFQFPLLVLAIPSWSDQMDKLEPYQKKDLLISREKTKIQAKKPNPLRVPPDTVWEEFLAYRQHCAQLKTIAKQLPPYNRGTFELKVDSNGIGHLRSVYSPPEDQKTDDWANQVGFYKSTTHWSPLTFSTASELFGTPRKRNIGGTLFYTFDARGTWGDEDNIYHLDLQFDSENVINAYRLRGIGINNPQWIHKNKPSIGLK